jgi:ankyrin repeat protein
MSASRTLEEVLQSTSDVLFPAEIGEKRVAVGSVGIDGDTPLHVMVWRNDMEGARLLVTAGADVNAVGDMGETSLHVAVRQGNAQLVVLLLQAGADPDIRSEFGKTAREEAAATGGAIAKLL